MIAQNVTRACFNAPNLPGMFRNIHSYEIITSFSVAWSRQRRVRFAASSKVRVATVASNYQADLSQRLHGEPGNRSSEAVARLIILAFVSAFNFTVAIMPTECPKSQLYVRHKISQCEGSNTFKTRHRPTVASLLYQPIQLQRAGSPSVVITRKAVIYIPMSAVIRDTSQQDKLFCFVGS